MIVATMVLSQASAQDPQQESLPEVLIITTGGTIASVQGTPMLEGPELIQAVPALSSVAKITVHEFSRIGSSQMTPHHWLGLLKFINQYLREHPEVSGIVITHGTDSMEETAFFLHLCYEGSQPIVLVGSMRASNEVSADGPANLLQAVSVAIHPTSAHKGVLAVLNENIASGRDLQKMHNRRTDSFRAGEFGFLGSIDPDGVRYYRNQRRVPPPEHRFYLDSLPKLPRVEIVQDFTDFDQEILTYFAARDIDGLVISTFAGGRMSGGMRSALSEMQSLPFPIVVASNIPLGRIIGNPTNRSDVIISHHFTPKKARILLMLALTAADRSSDIQLLFENN